MKATCAIRLLPLLVMAASAATAQNSASQPNVIFILTDDQGYGDLGCHGNPLIRTPHLDRLHAESVRFTNCHSGTTCAPTRASLMTGKYSNRVGVWHTINGREILAAGETTLAGAMKAAGYRTGIFGKWHLGDNFPFRPNDRGFDEAVVHGGGGVGQQPDFWGNDYFDDWYFRNGNPEKFAGYCTDVWFSEAVRFIRDHKHRPFFCYIATNAPHSPYHVEAKYSDLYAGNPQVPNPQFYGMITNIDDNIGRLRQELEDLDIARNTILVFMTDNGTSAGVRFGKQGEVTAGYNAGMRGIKGSPYEGGHRVPLFIHWPGAAWEQGRDVSHLVSCIDLMPTLLDVCRLPFDEASFDGRSLKPLIEGDTAGWPARILVTDTQREEFLVKWKQPAVMTDRWRLIGRDELYDMPADPGQRNNVAGSNPEVVEELRRAYERWWEDVSGGGQGYSRIIVGNPRENPVRLNSHDLHVAEGQPAWSQDLVRAAHPVNGFWAIEVETPGRYIIELFRWPKESGLKMHQPAPHGEPVPGGKPYVDGKALNTDLARVRVGERQWEKKIRPSAAGVKLEVTLPAGPAHLQTWLIHQVTGESWPAYYLHITAK